MRVRADRPPAVRLGVSAVAGALTGLLVGIVGPWWLIPLVGWDVATGVFLIWMWRTLWPMDAEGTSRHARREDPARAARELLLLCASIVSLLAVGLVLVRAGGMKGLDKGLLVGMSVASIVLSWSVVHTVYSLRYAALYYGGEPGGVDFNEEQAPCYADFAYLSLTIGMTFQVSDTDLQAKQIRRTAIGHALLSYAFGALIIAATINLIAGLGK